VKKKAVFKQELKVTVLVAVNVYNSNVLCRKKAKTATSAAAELVSNKLCVWSADKSDMSDCPAARECETDPPVTQYQPQPLSQLERPASELTEFANCSVQLSKAEVGLDSQSVDAISVANEVQNGGSGVRLDSVMATEDTRNTDEPELVEHDAANYDQFKITNHDSTETSVSFRQVLPTDSTGRQAEEVKVAEEVTTTTTTVLRLCGICPGKPG